MLLVYHGEQLCLHWNRTYNFDKFNRIFNAYGNRVSFNQGYGAAFSISKKKENKPLQLSVMENKKDFILQRI